MMGEEKGRKVRYFHVQDLNDLENSSKYSGFVFRVNELKGDLENLSGSNMVLKEANFQFSREGYVVDSSKYSIEEINKAKAMFIVAEQDQEGKLWPNYLKKMASVLNIPLEGRV